MSRSYGLSPLETLVVRSMAAGNVTYAEIAADIGYAKGTVRQAGMRARHKVGARNSVHLAFMIAGHMPALANLCEALQAEPPQ